MFSFRFESFLVTPALELIFLCPKLIVYLDFFICKNETEAGPTPHVGSTVELALGMRMGEPVLRLGELASPLT